MRVSDKMIDFTAFMVTAETYGFNFSDTPDLINAENLLNQMKNFVNSADFLNEITAIFNRGLREIQAEKLKRKGY